MKMKEQTYGWYPSAKNVYEDRRIDTLTPYQLEALYRYRDSKYYQPPVTPPEERTSRSKSSASRTSSKPASHHSQNEAQTNLQLRVQSAPIHTTYKQPPRLNLPTPQQCWSTHVPETEITVLPPRPSPAPSISATMPREITPKSVTPTQSVQVTAVSPTTSQKIARIQSAKVRRETPTKPQRPVQSAGPVRPSPSPVCQVPTPQSSPQVEPTIERYMGPTFPPTFECSWPQPSAINIDDIPATEGIQLAVRPPSGRISVSRKTPTPGEFVRPASSKRATPTQRKVPSPSCRPPSGRRTPLRPLAPSPNKMELHLEEDEYLERGETPDYDEEAKKYGWMLEVHGDPLKIKKVSRRLPYTVKVDEPETERDPPKVHMENNETFFYNTIPRRPYAFSIDKEWISEMIHKKRMDMQKKHGINYRYKNFSFVY